MTDIRMHEAAFANDIDELERLKVNGLDQQKRTPMHHAAEANAVNSLYWLWEQGGMVDARDYMGETPLFSAMRSNAIDAMKWLKEYHADLSAKRENGDTLLQAAQYTEGVTDATLEWIKDQHPFWEPSEQPSP